MSYDNLGTLEDLPASFVQSLADIGSVPLWPNLAAALPQGRPFHATLPHLWSYKKFRPLLLEAAKLTTIEQAERRVLVFSNPGLDIDTMRATPTIYMGMQLLLPGEVAPSHRHTPAALRVIVEGSGAYTAVNGEKCFMEKGDVILTPQMMWHEHGHQGTAPVMWLDILDLPLISALEASMAEPGPDYNMDDLPDKSKSHYRRSGLLPCDRSADKKQANPLLRYSWQEVRAALNDMAAGISGDATAKLAYVNPETGEPCLKVLGLSAERVAAGQAVGVKRQSASAAVHVLEGRGEIEIDGVSFTFEEGDTLAIPTHASVQYASTGLNDTYLLHADDAPLHRFLGIYQESS